MSAVSSSLVTSLVIDILSSTLIFWIISHVILIPSAIVGTSGFFRVCHFSGPLHVVGVSASWPAVTSIATVIHTGVILPVSVPLLRVISHFPREPGPPRPFSPYFRSHHCTTQATSYCIEILQQAGIFIYKQSKIEIYIKHIYFCSIVAVFYGNAFSIYL
jgi:hypothetical protein